MTLGAWLAAGFAVVLIVGGALFLSAWFQSKNGNDGKW
jgi:hypothetical protein